MVKLTALVTAFLVMIIAGSGLVLGAEKALYLQNGHKEYELFPYASVLEAPDQLEISDILEPETQSHFTGPLPTTPNFGYSSHVRWLRIPIHNTSLQKVWLFTIQYPPLDHLDLYIQEASGAMIIKKAGDALPFMAREVINRHVTFPLELAQDEDVVLYLRVETEGAMALPMKLYNPVGYIEHEQGSYMGLGIYFGMLIILIIYNGVLAFSLRSRAFFYYVGINIFVLFLYGTLNGLAFQYIWPESVWWNNRAIVFFICLSHAATLMFTRSFLDGKTHFPVLHRIFAYFTGFELLNIAVLFINYPLGLQLSMYSLFIIDSFIVAAGVISLRKGLRLARYFLLGWGLFITGAIVSSLADAGYIPYNTWTAYASQLGSALEALVLSWALPARIKQMREEKEVAVAAMRETRHLADHDDLTGLYNRRYLLASFQSLFAGGRKVSVLLVDVDHFKKVNDTYGHEAGDLVLQRIARLLYDSFRSSDIVARYGGEEFIVMLPDTNIEMAQRMAERVLQTVKDCSFDIEGNELNCTVSIGLSQWEGNESDDIQSMIRRADEALYEAKQTGRNRVAVQAETIRSL